VTVRALLRAGFILIGASMIAKGLMSISTGIASYASASDSFATPSFGSAVQLLARVVYVQGAAALLFEIAPGALLIWKSEPWAQHFFPGDQPPIIGQDRALGLACVLLGIYWSVWGVASLCTVVVELFFLHPGDSAVEKSMGIAIYKGSFASVTRAIVYLVSGLLLIRWGRGQLRAHAAGPRDEAPAPGER